MVRIKVLSICAQPLRDMLAQWRIAERVAITRNLHRGHARQLMQRLAHPCFVEPFGRHPPATGLDRNRMIGENIGQEPGCRSEERRGVKEWVSTGRYRWSPKH